MDNPVFLDEEIPFVESGVYEIDEATGVGNGTTTLGHGNLVSLNHQTHHFQDDPMWSTTTTSIKRGRRPKSAAVVITRTTAINSSPGQKPEPKRRGRKPKQEILSSTNVNDDNLGDILSESTEDIEQKQARRSTAGMRSNKRLKNDQQLSGMCKYLPPSISIHPSLLSRRW